MYPKSTFTYAAASQLHIPIITLTAYSHEYIEDTYKIAGISEIAIKSIQMNNLKISLNGYFSKSNIKILINKQVI